MSDDKGTPAAAGSAQRPKHRHLADSVSDYIVDHAKEDDVLRRLRMETLTLGRISVMQVSPDQGRFLALLARLVNAERALEVGTFTGYSALCVARALPDHGKLVTLDVSEEWTAVAKRYWEEAGVAHKIDLRLAPAVESLDRMIADGLRGHFDIAFVDADKANYPEYYERALALIHVGA